MSLMRTLPLETVKANSITLVKAAQILGIPQVWSSSMRTRTRTGGYQRPR